MEKIIENDKLAIEEANKLGEDLLASFIQENNVVDLARGKKGKFKKNWQKKNFR